jgi:hypothetical protein
MQLGTSLKVEPLMVQKDFNQWSKDVGAAASALGISILTTGSVQVGPGNYRSMLNKAGKKRIVVSKDPSNRDNLLFQVEGNSLKSIVVQEKPPDEREGWEKLNDKSKLQKMLKWKNSQNEQKSLEGDTIFKLNTKAAGPKLGMDQSYEVDTEFGPVRFASGDQRWVDDGMAFFDKVTHIVEHDKERRARLLLWDLMARSLVGAEVSSICKMCPIQGDIAYVYTKVREWAELVNPFTYFNQVRAYFTKE